MISISGLDYKQSCFDNELHRSTSHKIQKHQLKQISINKHISTKHIIMGRFAERRQARRENRQENRQDRRSSRLGSIKSSYKDSVTSSCSSKSSKGSCKSSHSSHKSSCKSSFSSSCSSKGSHKSHGDGNNTFVMREKLLTFGKDFEIKEASHRRGGHTGETKFYVDNKVLRVRETFNIRSSRHVYVIP